MTLFKLSASNMKKSIKDYAIYFFTLVLGVAIFYVFNAIETQTAMLRISADTRQVVQLMSKIIAGVSVVHRICARIPHHICKPFPDEEA